MLLQITGRSLKSIERYVCTINIASTTSRASFGDFGIEGKTREVDFEITRDSHNKLYTRQEISFATTTRVKWQEGRAMIRAAAYSNRKTWSTCATISDIERVILYISHISLLRSNADRTVLITIL